MTVLLIVVGVVLYAVLGFFCWALVFGGSRRRKETEVRRED